MSAKKDVPVANHLQRSDSYKLANGHDALKRVREGELDEEVGSTSKRPDLRNPFSKTETSLDLEEGKEETERNSNGGHEGDEAVEKDTATPRTTSTPAALMRRMSLENGGRRVDLLDPKNTSSVPDKPSEEESQSVAVTRLPDVKEEATVADDSKGETSGGHGEPSSAAPPVPSAPSVLPVLPEGATVTKSEDTPPSFVFGQNLSSKIANTDPCGSGTFGGVSMLAPFGSSSGFAGFAATDGFLFANTLKNLSKDTTMFGGFGLVAPSADEKNEKEEKNEKRETEEKKELSGTSSSSGPTGPSGSADSSGSTGPSGSSSSTGPSGSSGLKGSSGETLQESANREYEAKQHKPVLEDVDVITGEESERNVFEINVKLYVLDKDTLQWKERGRAIARLNDAHDKTYSRLVVRMAGTLRIIINTKLWKEMSFDRPSERNVSFSAFDTTDENNLKVFLISCSPDNASHVLQELKVRIERIRGRSPRSPLGSRKEKVSPASSLEGAPSSASDQPIKKSKTEES